MSERTVGVARSEIGYSCGCVAEWRPNRLVEKAGSFDSAVGVVVVLGGAMVGRHHV